MYEIREVPIHSPNSVSNWIDWIWLNLIEMNSIQLIELIELISIQSVQFQLIEFNLIESNWIEFLICIFILDDVPRCCSWLLVWLKEKTEFSLSIIVMAKDANEKQQKLIVIFNVIWNELFKPLHLKTVR